MRQTQTMADKNKTCTRHGERGVALITVLLISLLIMAAAGMLLLTTTMSATNAISSTDEVQAYYAAEAGLQDALNVLRGNVHPTEPNDGTKINFKNAINVATSIDPNAGMPLSRWLVYNYPSTTPTRVTLSPNYTDVGGIAYSILPITDPDA